MLVQEKLGEKPEPLKDKLGRIANRVKNAGKQIAEVFQEEVEVLDDLSSVHEGTLNFERLEDDIKQIHKQLEGDGSVVMGSYIIFHEKDDLMEIQIYKQRGDKNFISTVKAKVRKITHFPAEIGDELKRNGSVKLHLKFDD